MTLAHCADLSILVGEAVEAGEGSAGARRLIPIIGGEVRGDRLNGRILPGGADFQLIRPDGVAEIHARYIVETLDGVRISIENSGVRHGPAEAMERLRRNEPVDPALIYFRSAPRFDTRSPAYDWLTRYLFVAEGIRRPNRVELSFFQVL